MASEEEVRGEVVSRVEDAFVERLAERVGATVRASAVFGEAVKRGNVKVIPVARARWGFGGGSGSSPDGSGTGGGGGGWISPIGYIEIHKDRAEFKPIRDPRRAAAVIAATGVVAGVLAGAILRRS